MTGGLLSLAGCLEGLRDRDADASDATETPPPDRGRDDHTEPTPDDVRAAWDPPVGDHEPVGQRHATFETLDRWHAGDGVEVTADADTAYGGTQSARVHGGSGTIRFDPGAPIDLSDQDVSFAMRIERPDETIVHLRLRDVDGNHTTFRSQYYGASYPTGFLRFAPSVTSYDADMSRIAAVLISIESDDETPAYWLDDVRFQRRQFDRAKFLFTFDDVVRSQYETAYPIMDDYGFPGALGVNTDFLGESGRLTLEELGELHEQGWSLGNHTHTHANLRELSRERQREEIETPREFLTDHGFDEPSIFYYPYGNADRTTLELVAEHHDLAYNAFTHWSTGLSPATPMAPYWTNRMLPRSAEPVERRIDLAIEAGAVCTPYWHTVADDGEIDPAEFEKICAYLDEKSDDIDVVLPEDVAFRRER